MKSQITLVEFLAPISGGARRDQVLSLLYFCHRYKKLDRMTVEDVRDELANARVVGYKRINVSDVLSKAGHYVDTAGISKGRKLWRLTSSGQKFVRELLKLSGDEIEIEQDIGSLTTVLMNISDPYARDFVEEGIKCLQINALRAGIVFLWSGAIRILQIQLIDKGVAALNVVLVRHDPNARKIARIDDFAYIKDRTVLLAAQEMGLLDKSQKDVMQEALDLRNRCGHPTKYKPGIKKTSSYIEDLASIVFK